MVVGGMRRDKSKQKNMKKRTSGFSLRCFRGALCPPIGRPWRIMLKNCPIMLCSNALVLRIVIMLTLCSLIIFLSRWHPLHVSKHGRLL